MNDAEELASTVSTCIPTTYARGSFYTKAGEASNSGCQAGARRRGPFRPPASRGEEAEGNSVCPSHAHAPRGSPARGTARGLSASLLPRTLTCFSLSLLAFSLPRGPLALPAGGEPRSRFLRGGLQLRHLLGHPGLLYPG